jgi:alpha-D-xyloside xylohydrolase
VSRLHRQGQRWVPILDPGIHIQEGYKAWEQGRNMDVWIKDISGNPYVGQVRTDNGQANF